MVFFFFARTLFNGIIPTYDIAVFPLFLIRQRLFLIEAHSCDTLTLNFLHQKSSIVNSRFQAAHPRIIMRAGIQSDFRIQSQYYRVALYVAVNWAACYVTHATQCVKTGSKILIRVASHTCG